MTLIRGDGVLLLYGALMIFGLELLFLSAHCAVIQWYIVFSTIVPYFVPIAQMAICLGVWPRPPLDVSCTSGQMLA